jgi:SAM-dependent methyltransferase
MSDWRAGYVAGIDYTYGNYLELSPQRARLLMLHAGLAAPDVATACELGFGQGLSINLNAAATGVKWYGTDFDPAQAGRAQEMARAAQSGAELHDDAFADFAERADLPDFDFIGLHGIWTWISNENRAIVVDFIRRKLKVGGILYISYNTFPGWSAFAPVRHLMSQHGARMGSPGAGIMSRMDGALEFMDKLVATNPLYAARQPDVPPRLASIRKQNRNYIAHEYFNENWDPMYFSQMAEWLAPAKVQYACPAGYVEHVDGLTLTQEQIDLLNSIPDLVLREDVRDFMVNRQFRRDYWVKGARPLSSLERSEQLGKLRFMLITPRPTGPLKIMTETGEAAINEELYGPIVDALADGKPRSIAQLARATAKANVKPASLMQAILFLSGNRVIAEVQDDAAAKAAWPATERLNTHIISKARSTADLGHVASPVLGSGMALSRPDQLFLLALDNRCETPAELAEYAWTALRTIGHTMWKDGKPMASPEEHRTELTALAELFLKEKLPILTALQIA